MAAKKIAFGVDARAAIREGVKKLAELPSRDVLLAQTLSAMQAVPASFVRVLSGIPLKLLYALKAIEAQKAEN